MILMLIIHISALFIAGAIGKGRGCNADQRTKLRILGLLLPLIGIACACCWTPKEEVVIS